MLNSTQRRNISGIVALMIPAALCGAQQPRQSPGQQQLEEIVVTAELRPTPLQQQAASVSVVDNEAIRDRAAQHLEEVISLAPNINYSSGTSRARFFQIRGIGERSQFQEPLNSSVGFLIDGVDFTGLGTAGTLFDVAQVEVLRGPQGLLHGANALGGLINVRSNDPASEPEVRLSGTLGDYDTRSLGLVGTGPLASEDLLYRVAFQTFYSDGYTQNKFLGRDNTEKRNENTLRGKLRWLAGADSTLDLMLLHVDIDNGYDAFSLDNTRETLSDQPGDDDQETTALAATWHERLGFARLQARLTAANSDTLYSFDEDWAFVGISPENEYSSFDALQRERDSYSAEIKLYSSEASAGPGWVAGIYYLANREDLLRRNTYLPEPFSSVYDTDTAALYGQLEFDLSDTLQLTAGARGEHRRMDYSDSNAVTYDSGDTDWGGRLALNYSLDEDMLIYASVSRGYRAGGVNATILSSEGSYDDPGVRERLDRLHTFDAEYLRNYEIGFKGSFLDSTLNTRLALFYMDRNDMQVKGSLAIQREDQSTTFLDYNSNAAAGRNYGMEIEMDWLLHERISAYLNLGLLATRYSGYINADGDDLTGRDQAQAPDYQFAVGADLRLSEQLSLNVSVEGKDGFYFSDRHETRAKAYELLNMNLKYSRENWSVSLWGRNLTDKDYYTRGFGSFGNDSRKDYVTEPYYQYGEPRVIGVSAEYSLK